MVQVSYTVVGQLLFRMLVATSLNGTKVQQKQNFKLEH